MAGMPLKRTNLLLETTKLRKLRRRLGARSNSEAVRLAIDRQLALQEGLAALRQLSERRTIADVFLRSRRTHP